MLELQGLLNQDGMDRSISQVVDFALRVAVTNAKAPPNEDFRDTGKLISDPFERTIWVSHNVLTTQAIRLLKYVLSD